MSGDPHRSNLVVWNMLPLLLTTLGFLVACLGQVCLHSRIHEAAAVGLLAIAVVLTLVAFRRLPGDKVEGTPGGTSAWDRRGLLALLVASLPAWVGAWLLALRWDSLYVGLLFYAWGLILVLAVCARREGWSLPTLSALRDHRVELTLLVLVLGLGLFLRLYRLDYYPPPGGISWNDEAQIGKDAYAVLHHGLHAWQFPFSVYATVLSFVTLGPSVLALRLTFIFLGFLILVVFYLLARELFRFPVALTVTFLFAVSRWHIAFSRLVLPSTPAMLLEVSTFYLLLRGRRTGGMMNYVLAGVTTGLGLYSHASFRIVPFLVLLLFAAEIWSGWRAQRRQGTKWLPRSLMPWSAFLAAAVVTVLPLAAIVWREPRLAFGERFSSVMPALFGDGGALVSWDLHERVVRLVGFFNYKGEAWGAVNLPDLPMLDLWTGALFVLGFGYCLFYFWRNKQLFYLSWFLITIIGGGLLTVDLRSHRFAGVMPVLFIFAGVFVEGAWASFRRALGESRDSYFAPLLLPVLALAGLSNYYVLFERQIHADPVRIEFTREISAVANYIASVGSGHYFYLFADYPYYSPGMDFAWMTGEAPGERGVDVLDVVPGRRPAGDEDLVYIFTSPYNVQALTEVVEYYYPQARVETYEGEYDRYTFVAAHVAAEEVQRDQGLLGYYNSGDDVEAQSDLVRHDRQLDFDWRVDERPLPAPFSAEWRGTLRAPEDGIYTLGTEPPGACRMHIDDLTVESGEAVDLVKGWHRLKVSCPGPEERDALRLVWNVPGQEPEAVPAELLSPTEEQNGVLVSVFEGPDWGGDPVEQSIQPVLSLLRMPTAWQSAFVPELEGRLYSLDCRGQIWVDEGGAYRFGLVPWNGTASLYVDGAGVVTLEAQGGRAGSDPVELGPGWHDLLLRYSYRGGEFSGVEVLWTPPGAETQVIPPEFMRPTGDLVSRVMSQTP